MSGAANNGAVPADPPFFGNAQVMILDPAHVMVPERIGFLHEDKAVALGRLMAVDGQRDPIKVVRNLPSKSVEACMAEGKQPWRLVTGAHRLRGAALEGMTVAALEVLGKAEDLVDLEASENLHRRPLGPLEHAKFTAALVQAAKERMARERGGLKQQQMAAKARWGRVKAGEIRAEEALRDEVEDAESQFATAYKMDGESWENTVGNALGMGRDAIYRALRLHRFIIEPFPELVEAVARHPIVGENAKQLREIADVKDETARRAVIEALLADPELSADEARVLAGIDRPDTGTKPAADQVLLNRVTATLARMRDADREATVEGLVLNERVPVKRRIFERLQRELDIPAPTKVPMAQASDALSEAIRVANALLSGEGVEDAELEQLRRAAQAVVFDIPDQDVPSTGSGRTGGET